MDKTAIAQHLKNNLGLGELFDFRLETVTADEAVMRLVFGAVHLRPGGTLSGPSLMTLVDAVVYALILFQSNGAVMAVTQNLNIHFLQKPPAGDVWAVAHWLRRTKRTAVAQVEIYDRHPAQQSENADDKILLASASVTYVLPKVAYSKNCSLAEFFE